MMIAAAVPPVITTVTAPALARYKRAGSRPDHRADRSATAAARQSANKRAAGGTS